MIGDLISAGLKFFGGEQDRRAQQSINEQLMADKEKDRALQREFAQSGIQWRAADAKAAGIHPVYALGGSGATYTPSAISLGSTKSALGDMGQDIGRAINATRTQSDREDAFTKTTKELTLQKMGLENELLASQIQRLKQTPNPPMPNATGADKDIGEHEAVPLGVDKQEKRKPLMLGGSRFVTQPGSSNAQDFEDRYGEMSDWIFGPAILWNDYMGQTEPFMGEMQGRRFREKLNKWLPKFLQSK